MKDDLLLRDPGLGPSGRAPGMFGFEELTSSRVELLLIELLLLVRD